ncbi:DNA polymerase IV [Virgibacillus halodenitrificans]|uniref:UV damage repair protein UvrX n=1 Tax=Virgibacillus halodenitrificans TaxID=1482 RepID=A0AAC9IZY5_VIRHA|nr:DNA polymerase IV [Virgibacillus halodenitrificans]APC48856.1 UV damage repair protein UvrX [Virgibacillus halodenitrificans]MCG1029376.1 DNA polymerase IV [Virgibacillus halodenitrificans]MEC2158496.1 DNA polymerase IV [Virgibacillus halodenitrificans]
MDYSSYPRNDVLCIDMRSFYASVEAVKLGLDPMKTLLAVVGDPNRSGSIVLAASPELKRIHGISNVSRFFELPDDPEIHIVPAHMADYLNVSMEITKLINQYVPKQAIHQYSVDEVWVTVNGLDRLFGDRWEVARQIKKDILDCFGITASIGIGDNKFLAKTVMDLHAKKVGIAECTYEQVKEKLWPSPIEDIWGIGSRMKRNLNRMGIVTLGQLARFDLEHLKKRFGVMGEQLYWHAWGIDLSPVFGDFIKTEQKGFGHGISLLRDYSKEEVTVCILDLCEEVCRRAREAGKTGRTVQLGISYGKETGGGFSRSKSIYTPTDVTMDVYQICLQLFQEFYDGNSNIRHVYVTLSNLFNKGEIQLNLFENRAQKNDIGYVMDAIRRDYGATAILRASSYTEAGITLERSKKIGGHRA